MPRSDFGAGPLPGSEETGAGGSSAQLWVQQRIADASARGAKKPAAISEDELHGAWDQPAPGRRIGQVFLALTSTGAVAGFGLLLSWQTFEALAILVAFTVVSLMSYTALSVSLPTHVTLEGPLVCVRRGRDVTEFDLTGRIRRVSTVGRPNRPNWRVHLESVEGTIVELGPTQVDPTLIHAAIARYRSPGIPPQRTES